MSFLIGAPAWLASEACCFGAAACRCLYCNMKCKSSTATRVVYALLFLMTSIVAWVMESDWVVNQLDKVAQGYLKQNCPENTCYGTLAVYRIMFTLSMFHLILSACTYGATTSRGVQGGIQNGYWGPKFIFLVFGCVGCFFIPNGFFEFWGKYIAIVGAVLFMLFQMFLLVDFAHSLTEMLLAQWEDSDNQIWGFLLAVLTFGGLALALIMTILGFVYFGTPECHLNQVFLSVNLVAAFVLCLISISEAVREFNPSSGLAQASVVVVYATYLVCSAMSSEPTPAPGSGTTSCNPLSSSDAAQTTTVVLGALLTFAVVSYSTTSSAMKGTVFGGADEGYVGLETNVEDGGDDDDDRYPTDDEKQGSVYSYSFYHFVFAIAAMYVAMLVTNWNTVTSNSGLTTVGRSWASVWVRAATSWVVLGLYVWTLVAPVLLPDREFY